MTAVAGRHLAILAAGFLLGGWFGLIVAGIGVAAVGWSRASAAWLPVALLGVAAVTTVVPEVPGDGSLRSSFAVDRPIAARAGLAAGILLLVVVVESVARDRRQSPAPTAEPGPPARRPDWGSLLARRGPVLAGAAAAAAFRLVVGGEALTTAERSAEELLRTGGGFTVDLPPVAVTLAAISPIGVTLLTALLAGALVVAVSAVVDRLDGADAGRTAVAVTALLPLSWALPLSATVGLLAVVTAMVAAWDRAPGAVRVFVGGLLLGVGTLARPELVLLAVAVLAWSAVRPRPLAPGAFVGLVATMVLSVLPWVVHVGHRTGTPGLASPLTDAVDALGGLVGGPGVAVLSVALTVAAVAAAAGQRRWLSRRLTTLVPQLAGLVLAVVLVAVQGSVVALYPSVPFTALVLARAGREQLARRAP